MWRRNKVSPDLEVLMAGVPRLTVHFSETQTAASLWDYAEDEPGAGGVVHEP